MTLSEIDLWFDAVNSLVKWTKPKMSQDWRCKVRSLCRGYHFPHLWADSLQTARWDKFFKVKR